MADNRRTCTIREPIPTITNPMIAFGVTVSPINATVNIGIQINMVLLIMLDSTAGHK
jgi:hypothetical protein